MYALHKIQVLIDQVYSSFLLSSCSLLDKPLEQAVTSTHLVSPMTISVICVLIMFFSQILFITSLSLIFAQFESWVAGSCINIATGLFC